ncbi:MAG TPA: hypothetical protein VIV14_00460 [Gammaproteobacteria bacterium]
MQRVLTTLILLAATTPLTAQWLTVPTPGVPRTADGELDMSAPAPRTGDGRPDLSGLWVPAAFEGSLFDPEAVHEWAQAAVVYAERTFFAQNPRFLCLPSGPAYLTAGRTIGGLRRIVQGSSVMAILYSDLIYRQVFLDGRELEDDPLPTWMGYSVGRWEGDTLVVESNGYNDKTWLHRRGLPHTEQLRVTERYHRSSFGHMLMEITFEDQGTFDTPLEAVIPMEYVADSELLETVCNEASEGRSNWGGEIAHAEAAAVDVAPEILANYVGSYEGFWSGRPITIEIVLQDGELMMVREGAENDQRNGDQLLRLIPRSESTFDCSCGWAYAFRSADGGPATEVDEIHVSGAWTFTRVQ